MLRVWLNTHTPKAQVGASLSSPIWHLASSACGGAFALVRKLEFNLHPGAKRR
jgi:hypothetical protein